MATLPPRFGRGAWAATWVVAILALLAIALSIASNLQASPGQFRNQASVRLAAEGGEAAGGGSTALTRFYPTNNGFLGEAERQFLMPGQAIDRFGGEGGRFASPIGTPLEARALPPNADLEAYNAYRIAKPFEVWAGRAALAFDQTGLGMQYLLPRSVGDLIRYGFLEPFEQ